LERGKKNGNKGEGHFEKKKPSNVESRAQIVVRKEKRKSIVIRERGRPHLLKA